MAHDVVKHRKVYAGIGARRTPSDVLDVMRETAYFLAKHGWTLRSGGAPGADTAFEAGAYEAYATEPHIPQPDIFLPWPCFNDHRADDRHSAPYPGAMNIAAHHHPAWARCNGPARLLHARNAHIILGADVHHPFVPRFVICWTSRGKRGGGTGQALRIADYYGVPIYDLALSAARDFVESGRLAD